MSLTSLLNGHKVVAVLGNQYGDEGKGKFVHAFGSWADVIVRGTGGANAGHTVVIDGEKYIFHLLPSGILYDDEGKENILGSGMAIGLDDLCKELDVLSGLNKSCGHLKISSRASVVLPVHKRIDALENQSQKNGGVGSTGRGIGPCYRDRAYRRGPFVADFFNKDVVMSKLGELRKTYPGMDPEAEYEAVKPHFDRLDHWVYETGSLMHNAIESGKRILVEGAQGLLLSVNHGFHPFVTSSDCSIGGTLVGADIPPEALDVSYGLVKFPLMSRVGNGPFATEIGGHESQEHCAQSDVTEEVELGRLGISHEEGKFDFEDVNLKRALTATDPLTRSMALRLKMGEYGSTTKRPRRLGWNDLELMKYARRINGTKMIATKVDCYTGCGNFGIGVKHDFDIDHPEPFNPKHLEYEVFEGFEEINATTFSGLPDGLKKGFGFLEENTGAYFSAISIGPEADQTIVRK